MAKVCGTRFAKDAGHAVAVALQQHPHRVEERRIAVNHQHVAARHLLREVAIGGLDRVRVRLGIRQGGNLQRVQPIPRRL
jgi:hypothetical protein